MEFSALPPEVTSALIHSGPGAGSSDRGFRRLAAARRQSGRIGGKSMPRRCRHWPTPGKEPSSQAMVAAVEPYLAWLRTTAQQCQQMAASAMAAAAAFSSARASVVPLAAVTANRIAAGAVVGHQRFGINLPAIAQTEDAVPDHVGEQLGGDESLSGGLGTSHARCRSSPRRLDRPIRPGGRSSQLRCRPPLGDAGRDRPALRSRRYIYGRFNSFDPNSRLGSDWRTPMPTSSSRPDFPINLLSYLAQNQVGPGTAECGQRHRPGSIGGCSRPLGGAARSAAWERAGRRSGAAGLAANPRRRSSVGVSIGKLTAPPAVVGLLPASQAPVQLASAATPLGRRPTPGSRCSRR